MHRLLFISCVIPAILAVAGCSKDNPYTQSNNTDVISFTVSSEDSHPGTKGSEIASSEIYGTEGKGIGVFAFYQKAKSNGYPVNFNRETGSPNFMDNQLVSQSDGSTWSYLPLKYWPNDEGDQLSFFAYAPYEESTAWEDLKISANLKGTELTRHYVVYDEVKDQQDYIWADPILNCSKPDVSSALSFNFTHLCARVSATCAVKNYNANDYYTITEVSISGQFRASANLVYYTESKTREWDNVETAEKTYVLFKGTQKIDQSSETTLGTEFGSAFLLPGTQDLTLKVEYTHHTSSGDVSESLSKSYSSMQLDEAKSYNFKIYINS